MRFLGAAGVQVQGYSPPYVDRICGIWGLGLRALGFRGFRFMGLGFRGDLA